MDSGQATFVLGDETVVVEAGHVVIGPPDVPHGFTNTGTGVRLTAIHGNPRFITRWLDATRSGRRRRGLRAHQSRGDEPRSTDEGDHLFALGQADALPTRR